MSTVNPIKRAEMIYDPSYTELSSGWQLSVWSNEPEATSYVIQSQLVPNWRGLLTVVPQPTDDNENETSSLKLANYLCYFLFRSVLELL